VIECTNLKQKGEERVKYEKRVKKPLKVEIALLL
jgi:hypothetical protein